MAVYYKRGSRGEEVKKLQQQLKNAGFDPGPIDGIFGPKTEAAVRAYQKANNLTVDGIAGVQTLGSLNKVTNATKSKEAPKSTLKVTPKDTSTVSLTTPQVDPDAADKELARQIRDRILAGTQTAPTQTTPTYGQLPAPYQNRFEEDTQALVDKILNFKPFSYDYRADPSYQAYERQYTQAGETAFQDTIGDLTAMTGGRLNTWAASAAAQAKNKYMQDLANIIPTLENQAYNRYLNEFNMLKDNLGTIMDIEGVDYDRYRDLIGDYVENRNYERGVFESDRAFDRDVLESDRAFDRSVFESDRAFDYQVTRDKILDDRWLKQFNADERQRMIQNALDQRQISVSEANALLNREEFEYRKSQGEKEKESEITPGQLANYNEILAGLKKMQPDEALRYMERVGKNLYVDLIGEELYKQLISEIQGGEKEPEMSQTEITNYYIASALRELDKLPDDESKKAWLEEHKNEIIQNGGWAAYEAIKEELGLY